MGLKDSPRSIRRRHTAIHEAGHAVVGRAVTMLCGEATIVPSDDELGSCVKAIVANADWAWQEWELREKFGGLASACKARIFGAKHDAFLTAPPRLEPI